MQIWLDDAPDKIQKRVQEVLDPFGSIYTIANSGATKAKFQQIRQLSGMRGLMADPSGRIMEIPVRGNFRDGLTVMEYFISSHGARKGLADTALRTAESGYLTRRLIDVAQDVIVSAMTAAPRGHLDHRGPTASDMNEPFRNRLIGRVLAAAVPGFEHYRRWDGDRTRMSLDEMIAGKRAAGLLPLGLAVPGAARRLPACAMAAIWRRANWSTIGDAVGIIAAQSIGEPGTQLTMRTFHTGGIAGARDITQGLPRVEELFESRTPKDKAIVSEIDGVVETPGGGQRRAQGACRHRRSLSATSIRCPTRQQVLVRDDDHVERDHVLARLPAERGSEPGGEVLARTGGDGVRQRRPTQHLSVRFEDARGAGVRVAGGGQPHRRRRGSRCARASS